METLICSTIIKLICPNKPDYKRKQWGCQQFYYKKQLDNIVKRYYFEVLQYEVYLYRGGPRKPVSMCPLPFNPYMTSNLTN